LQAGLLEFPAAKLSRYLSDLFESLSQALQNDRECLIWDHFENFMPQAARSCGSYVND
jgi:hypothetical protein